MKHDPPYDQWPVSDGNPAEHEHIGVTGHEGQMLFADKSSHMVYTAQVDHEAEEVGPPETGEFQLGAEETLGEFIERVGDEAGWEWLSDWAQEHLEDENR